MFLVSSILQCPLLCFTWCMTHLLHYENFWGPLPCVLKCHMWLGPRLVCPLWVGYKMGHLNLKTCPVLTIFYLFGSDFFLLRSFSRIPIRHCVSWDWHLIFTSSHPCPCFHLFFKKNNLKDYFDCLSYLPWNILFINSIFRIKTVKFFLINTTLFQSMEYLLKYFL